MIFKVFVLRELLPVAPFSFKAESDWRGIHLHIKYKIQKAIVEIVLKHLIPLWQNRLAVIVAIY